MKKILFVMGLSLLCVLMLNISVQASVIYSDSSDLASWEIHDDGSLILKSDTELYATEELVNYNDVINTLVIGENVTEIKPYLFHDLTNIEKIYYNAVDAKSGSTNINGEYISPFDDVSKVTEIVVGDGVVSIPQDIFNGFSSVTSLHFPESLTTIRARAFKDTKITEITIPENVALIENGAFAGCSSLKTFNLNAVNLDDANNIFHTSSSNYTGNITKLVISDDVKTIPTEMFSGCSYLKTIEGGTSLKSIGAYAFRWCSNLTEFNFPNGLESIGSGAFLYTTLKQVIVPDTVTSIGSSAFLTGCLEYLQLPFTGELRDIVSNTYFVGDSAYGGEWKYNVASVKNIKITGDHIPDNAFADVLAETVDISNARYIGAAAFADCTSLKSVNMPETLDIIGEKTFYNCHNLVDVKIPSGVTEIGSMAFSRCYVLEKVDIPASVTKIGSAAFEYCGALKSITIPESLTEICSSAFLNCSQLNGIAIPKNVTEIGYRAFCNCAELSDIAFSGNIEYIDSEAFSGTSWLENQPDGLVYIDKVAYFYKGEMDTNTSVAIKDGIVSVASRAFYEKYKLREVKFPDTLKEIGGAAFRGCELEKLNLPDGLKTIGGSAFENCELTNVVIPDSVEEIGQWAFFGCNMSPELTIPANLKILGGYAFHSLNCMYLYYNAVDCSSVDWESLYGGKTVFGGNILNIVIEKNVTKIPKMAFGDNKTVKNVYYCGSEEEWQNVVIESDNECILNADIQFDADVSQFPEYLEQCGDNILCTLDDGVLTLIGHGPMYNYYDYNNEYAPWYDRREEIKAIVFDGEITSIGEDAFMGCTEMTAIEIPESIIRIGQTAFLECTSLETVTAHNNIGYVGANAFSKTRYADKTDNWYKNGLYLNNCLLDVSIEPLDTFEFKKTTTTIANSAFWKTNINKIVVPYHIKNIGNFAFGYCTSDTIEFDCNELISFGHGLMNNCHNLKHIVIPSSRGHISLNATFKDCSALQSVVIPTDVTSIYDSFAGCSNLRDIYYIGSEEQWNEIDIYDDVIEAADGITIHYNYPYISYKTVVSDDGLSIIVTVKNIQEGEVMLYESDVDGKCMVTCKNVDGNDIPFDVSENTKKVKIFVWDSLDSMKPLAATEEIDL